MRAFFMTYIEVEMNRGSAVGPRIQGCNAGPHLLTSSLCPYRGSCGLEIVVRRKSLNII